MGDNKDGSGPARVGGPKRALGANLPVIVLPEESVEQENGRAGGLDRNGG